MESSLQDYSTIRFYLSQLVLAVSFLHNRNVYHRDIKPENMLLHPITGSLVLGDFGSCIIVPPSTDHISDCQLNGTPEYTAPELVPQKEKGRLAAPDWWGVGLVAYEMCLAALPYTRDSNDPENVELYFAISSFDSVPFPKTFSALPQDVQQLLKRFLEKEWKKRLGCGEKKEDEVMEMSFFRGVDWKGMLLGSTHPWGG
ncbi:kinase-like protein, partial [Atractiella rhizophila]